MTLAFDQATFDQVLATSPEVAGRVLNQRELGLAFLKAFEGDLRFVGLTQKFTGLMKTLLAQNPLLKETSQC